MLTIECLLAVMGLCATFFGLGFSIGLSLGAKKKPPLVGMTVFL